MGQSSSTGIDLNRQESSYGFWPPAIMFGDAMDSVEEIDGDLDYTGDIPDECLAYVFQFLGAADRKRCSLVSKRWLRVDGQSRHRISLNARNEIEPFLSSLFVRFDSVTKLALRCDRKSISINDEVLTRISIRCRNLTRLKLRGCREVTEVGMTALAQNCKKLKKLSCGSCMFGATALNAVLYHCSGLEELSVKRLRGIHDKSELIGPGAAASSLKSICLKELVSGQSFEPLVTGSRNLKTLRIIRCLGDWDKVLQLIGNSNSSINEIHLERLQVSDVGLSAISRCQKIESLHIVKTPECSNLGLITVAERCTLLRKLHIDGWRTNRIGDEGLITVAKHCVNLQELVLIGVNATHMSLSAIASSCSKLERLALCGSATIGDAEMACIAAKCMALKKFCVKGCPISDIGIEALAWGCPNLVKIKVKKCRGVSGEVGEWLRERRTSLVVNMDDIEVDGLNASSSDGPANETTRLEFPPTITNNVNDAADASTNGGNGRMTLFRAKFGFLVGRNFVACTFRRWANNDDAPNDNNNNNI